MQNKPEFIFFGTPHISANILTRLFEAGFIPKAIVTGIDKPKGRNLTLSPSEVSVWATAHGIPVLKPEKLTQEFEEELRSYGVDCFVVVAYGKILKKSLLSIPPKGVLNVHPSLLPYYRGATPIESALLHNEEKTGVSIMLLDEEMDHGPVLAQEEVNIGTLTKKELYTELEERGARLLCNVLLEIKNGTIKPQEQDHSKATFSKKIKKEDGEIDPDGNAEENWNKFRAYSGWPGLFFFKTQADKKIRIKITDAVYENGMFIIKKVIPEGKKEIEYALFKKETSA